MNREGKGGRKVPCAYTAERVAAIRQAMREWYRTLPSPRNLIAAQKLETSGRTVSIYVSSERPQCGPSPEVMLRLWDETQNPVFQMSDAEKEIFRQRGYRVPGEGDVGADEKKEAVSESMRIKLGLKSSENKTAPDKIVGPMSGAKVSIPFEKEPTKTCGSSAAAFPGLAQKLLMGMSVNLSVISDLMPEITAETMFPEIKNKAAELVKKIVQVFKLTPDDFAPKHPGAEAGLSEGMEKVLDTVFGKQE